MDVKYEWIIPIIYLVGLGMFMWGGSCSIVTGGFWYGLIGLIGLAVVAWIIWRRLL